MKRAKFLCLFLLALSALPSAAWAGRARVVSKPAETASPSLPSMPAIVANYDVYVGGLHFVTSSFLFENSSGKYSIRAAASTNGFWHFMFPWDAKLISQGKVEGTKLLPQSYDNTSIWRGDAKTVSMRYDDGRGIALDINPPDKPSPKRNIVTPEQRQGAMDPLASIVQLLGDLAVGGSCVSSAPVFDGSRRFDLISKDMGWRETDPDGYGVYKGRARMCEVGFHMVAGEWKDRERSKFWLREDGTQGRDPFTVWLAQLSPGLPEMAVRAESQSVWGRIVIHLSSWRPATPQDMSGEIPG